MELFVQMIRKFEWNRLSKKYKSNFGVYNRATILILQDLMNKTTLHFKSKLSYLTLMIEFPVNDKILSS